MAAQLRIDQAGLSAGTAGKSRTDGLDTGADVTLTNTGAGETTVFRLLWSPPGDTTAADSLAPTGDPKVWTFTPTAGVYGSYLFELIENEGLGSEVRERRVLVVRTPNLGLVIPALNERGDSSASLLADGASQIEAADNNADDFPDADLNFRPYAAWWRSFHELATTLDNAGSSGADIGVDATLLLDEGELSRRPISGHIEIPEGSNVSAIRAIPSNEQAAVSGGIPYVFRRRLIMADGANSTTAYLGTDPGYEISRFPFNALLVDAWMYVEIGQSGSSLQLFKNTTNAANILTSAMSSISQGQVRNADNRTRTISAGDNLIVRKSGAAFAGVVFDLCIMCIRIA